jgi:uncharacterized protein (TIGR03000 family)
LLWQKAVKKERKILGDYQLPEFNEFGISMSPIPCSPKEKAMRSFLVSAVLGIGLCGLMPRALLAAQPKPLPAAILVHLPADAKLTVDDHATTSTSATRQFITPPLERGRIFHYTLKAEFVRGSETIMVKKKVRVRADRETVVTLHLPRADSRDYPSYATGPFRPGVTQTRAYYLAPESEEPSSDGAYSPGYDHSTYSDDYGAYPRSYSPLPSSSSNVAPASEQDPIRNAGPPGSNNPLSLGVGQG